ncbi:hypothetical protein [uncultured Gammaproteobacteria bacterium]|nr:hypothetical protein [uncultured Gammaproteobacteria bacterium]
MFYYDKYRRIRIEYLSKRLNLNEKKITKLANKLFALYIQDVLKIGGDFYNFRYFFPYPPNNQTNILLNIMSDQLSKDDNEKLFNLALSFLPQDDQNTIIPTQEIKKKSKLMCLESTLNLWLNPEIQLWETEQKAKIQQKIKIDKKTAMRNEIYFKNQTDIDIQKNLNILFNVSRFLIYGHYNYLNDLTDNTVDRLKNILKNAVFKPLINPDLLTIDSLAKDNTDANRDIDRMYYASCVLNEPKKMEKITNSDFLKYLYINSLVRDTKSNYCKYKEKNRTEMVISTLKEYVELVSKTYFSIMKSYIEPENSMEKLKKLIRDIYNENIQKSVLNNFLSIYNFSISLDDLRKLQAHAHGGNEDEIIALIVLLDEQEDDFTLKRAISLYRLLGTEQREINLSDIKSNIKIRFINYLMNVFDTEKSINPISGMPSDKDSCAYFLREALNQLDLKELRQLLDNRKNKENCIWINRINHQITQIKQKNTDQQYSPYSISQLKNFILSDDITSSQDFFQDTVIKIKKLKNEIEGNRCNEKEAFFNEDNNGKQEDACRDIIMQRLKDKYGDDIQLTKEQHEANNRVDINISTVKRPKYEVQIECKKDSNRGINRGIPDQLIKKYLSRQAEHGIYLIFNFSKIKKSLLINKVRQSIPEDYKNDIEIIIIDLKKSS